MVPTHSPASAVSAAVWHLANRLVTTALWAVGVALLAGFLADGLGADWAAAVAVGAMFVALVSVTGLVALPLAAAGVCAIRGQRTALDDRLRISAGWGGLLLALNGWGVAAVGDGAVAIGVGAAVLVVGVTSGGAALWPPFPANPRPALSFVVAALITAGLSVAWLGLRAGEPKSGTAASVAWGVFWLLVLGVLAGSVARAWSEAERGA